MDNYYTVIGMEIESTINFCLDKILTRKRLTVSLAYYYKMNMRNLLQLELDMYNKNNQQPYYLDFYNKQLPYFLAQFAGENHSQLIIVKNIFSNLNIKIGIQPNLVQLHKNNNVIILYDNFLSNESMNPFYYNKPYTTPILKLYNNKFYS